MVSKFLCNVFLTIIQVYFSLNKNKTRLNSLFFKQNMHLFHQQMLYQCLVANLVIPKLQINNIRSFRMSLKFVFIVLQLEYYQIHIAAQFKASALKNIIYLFEKACNKEIPLNKHSFLELKGFGIFWVMFLKFPGSSFEILDLYIHFYVELNSWE